MFDGIFIYPWFISHISLTSNGNALDKYDEIIIQKHMQSTGL